MGTALNKEVVVMRMDSHTVSHRVPTDYKVQRLPKSSKCNYRIPR